MIFYCFVYISKEKATSPKIFIVPSKEVAEYVEKEHKHWLNSEHIKQIKDTNIRIFRIELDKLSEYENNFSYFE